MPVIAEVSHRQSNSAPAPTNGLVHDHDLHTLVLLYPVHIQYQVRALFFPPFQWTALLPMRMQRVRMQVVQ